jgi:amino acid transporter
MASKCSFWTLTVLRLLSAFVTGLQAPYTDLRLLDASSYLDVAASPIRIAMADRDTPRMGLKLLQGLVVLTQLSVALSSVFGVSRAITSLAWQGQAPRLFTLRDRSGRPMMSLGIAAIAAFLGFISTSDLSPVLFAWLLGIGGIPALFVQTSIFVAHIRFRKGMRKQGHSLSRFSGRWLPGTVGSWVGIFFNLLVIACQIWTGIGPMGFSEVLSEKVIGSEFAAYVYIPASIALYGAYKLWRQTRWRRSLEMEFTINHETSNE